jgi:hypothetical protein
MLSKVSNVAICRILFHKVLLWKNWFNGNMQSNSAGQSKYSQGSTDDESIKIPVINEEEVIICQSQIVLT